MAYIAAFTIVLFLVLLYQLSLGCYFSAETSVTTKYYLANIQYPRADPIRLETKMEGFAVIDATEFVRSGQLSFVQAVD